MVTFSTGKQAILFYVEARMRDFITAAATAQVVKDEGQKLQYDANTLPGPPAWAEITDVLIDIEKIMESCLSPLEIRALLKWAMDEADDESLSPNLLNDTRPDMRLDKHEATKEFSEMSRQGKWYRIWSILIKLEEGLMKFGYMKKKDVRKHLQGRRVA